MPRLLTLLIAVSALALSACAPTLPPSEAPVALRDAYADTLLALDATERCSGFTLDEETVDNRFEDILAEMIEAGFSSDQYAAYMEGMFWEDDWFIPYAIRFERRGDIDIMNDAEFCGQMDRERRARTSIGRLFT